MPWIHLLWNLVSKLDGLQLFFLVCAVVGGLLFLLRLVLAIFAGDGHDLEPGMEVGDAGDIIGDSDATFRVLSVQGMLGFLLIFGLTGLTMSIQMEASHVVSVGVAFGAGFLTMLLLGWITLSLRGLDRSGNIRLDRAVGAEGTVYLTIPEGGTGQAQVNVQNRLRVIDALSEDKQEIETGTRVKVVRVVGDDTLVVERS